MKMSGGNVVFVVMSILRRYIAEGQEEDVRFAQEKKYFQDIMIWQQLTLNLRENGIQQKMEI